MDVIEAIFARQSVSKVRPDPVPRELIEKLLEAAVQAPNHHHVRPWRFIVLSGEARNRLGDVMAQSLKKREPDVRVEALDVERARPLRAPVLIVAAVDPAVAPKVVQVENVAAVAAAVENLLLAAVDLGLACMWRTGKAAYDPSVKEFLGLTPEQQVIGFIYTGYPEFERPPADRPSYQDRVRWMDR